MNAKEMYRVAKSTKRTRKHRNVGEWGMPIQRKCLKHEKHQKAQKFRGWERPRQRK